MSRTLFLVRTAAERIRAEVARARDNEVCFVAQVGEDGDVREARPVARGHRDAVLAAVRDVEPGMLVIHNHPSGALDPSDADLEIAADLYERGVGLAITDNTARELYVVVEPAATREYELVDEQQVEVVLAPGGPLGRAHPSYEDRPTQRAMAREVARAYNEGGVALAEAGTGTGKSIAYLLPAVRWAAQNRERTIVSTNTINLQEQLVGKDLPFLRKALGQPFRFALVKGRANYISIRRAQLAHASAPTLFEGSGRSELDAILSWMGTTSEGSLQDLPFQPSAEVWDEVASESDVCLRTKCPHFEQCFYQRARRTAAAADILVVNHHLLFSDLAVRRARGDYTASAVLPPYRRVVLDEAHNLEDAATSHMGAALSRRALERLLGRLDRGGKGLLTTVALRLRAGQDDLLHHDAVRRIESELRPDVERAREQAMALFDGFEQLVASSEDGLLRVADEFLAQPQWVDVLEPLYDGLVIVLGQLANGLDRLREQILFDARWADALDEQLLELEAMAERTRTAAEALQLVFRPGKTGVAMVRWLERRGVRRGTASVKQGSETRAPDGAVPDGAATERRVRSASRIRSNMAACAAPIELGGLLRESLFERVDTAVLTSATLATRTGFAFLRDRLGLGGGLKLSEAVYPSPFNFEDQTLVVVPTDLPAPRAKDSMAFDRATAGAVRDIAESSDGGIFVLFTAYRSLRAVAARLRQGSVDARWPLFVHGEAPRAHLIERFTASGRGILLGVASFWEGVDVPGHPLRGLVIAKLPFKVPSEPITAARVEAIEQLGGNAFTEYMLPHAALRLKQGFGRLIRSQADRGAVVLLDRRVIESRYGPYFLESLPPAPVQTAPWAELKGALGRFYGRG